MAIAKRLTAAEWKEMVDRGKVLDLSRELPNSFLVYGQWMRAKVRIGGQVYRATGWAVGADAWVDLEKWST